MLNVKQGSCEYQFSSHWFDPTRNRTPSLPIQKQTLYLTRPSDLASKYSSFLFKFFSFAFIILISGSKSAKFAQKFCIFLKFLTLEGHTTVLYHTQLAHSQHLLITYRYRTCFTGICIILVTFTTHRKYL